MVQLKSPTKAPPKPPPFNVFVAKASLPNSGASADSAGTTYSEEVWRGGSEEIKRCVNEESNMSHATSSLTAAGSSAASSLTAAGGSDRTVADQEQTRAPVTSSLTKDWWSNPTYEDVPVEWPTRDESFYAWLKSDSGKPDPPVAAPL